ncbi:MAG: glycosyltransferase [Hyphomicrobiales bacterium]
MSEGDLTEALAGGPRWALRHALRGEPFPLRLSYGRLGLCGLAGVHTPKGARAPDLLVHPQALQDSLLSVLRRELMTHAVDLLSTASPALSARHGILRWQAAALLMLVLGALIAMLAAPQLLLVPASVAFLALSSLKFTAVLWRLATRRSRTPLLLPADLPVYTVLVPLYREDRVVGQLLDALASLDYPPEKLDVKLVVEERDRQTLSAIAAFQLPPWITVLRVPEGGPKTKPKALNIALPFSRGEFVVVYDAEDLPARDQLKRAVSLFHQSGPEVVCLQARLAFHSGETNWLTRQFAIEYDLLFGTLLPLLSRVRLPFPLGGTSNHFRTAVLKQMGAWDPFNVTEDADLGFRLARLGLRAATLDSVTLEEPVTDVPAWLRQRTRWLKGFLQTWLVLMRTPVLTARQMGPCGFLVMNLLMAGTLVSGIAHPWCLAIVAVQAARGHAEPVGVAVLLAGHAMAIGAPLLHLADSGRLRGYAAACCTVPFHWLLVSAASYSAVVEFAVAPFRWNKTEHGRLQFGRRRVLGPV